MPGFDFSFSGNRKPVPASSATAPTPLLGSIDPIVAAQVRFGIEGTGPIASRRIEPVTPAAAELVARTPAAVDAVRGVLELVEHVAGGPGASSGVDFRGVSFASDVTGFGANTWRAHAEAPSFRQALAKLPSRRQAAVLEQLATRSGTEAASMLANVASGWMNLGPTASAAVLSRAGVAPATPVTTQQLADTVRILTHEAVHAVDTTPTGLSQQATHGIWEALAEARTMTMPSLQAARASLGLDGAVPDAALAQSLLHRPYADLEHTLATVMQVAGIQPGSAVEQRVLNSRAPEAVDLLAARLAATTGYSSADARGAIEDIFAKHAPGSR